MSLGRGLELELSSQGPGRAEAGVGLGRRLEQRIFLGANVPREPVVGDNWSWEVAGLEEGYLLITLGAGDVSV